jgi:putative salt-induced outer membrane protein
MQKLSLLAIATLIGCGHAMADDIKADGQWRGVGGAAASASSGNTRNSTVNLSLDAARVTAVDKWSMYGQALFAQSRTDDKTSTTANLWRAGTRYDHNLNEKVFGFGGLDLEHDQLKHLTLRGVISGGLGYHVIKTDDTTWDVFGGLAYKADRYSAPGVMIDNAAHRSYTSPEAILGEESSHKLSDTTSFKQRLVVYPSLRDTGEFRAVFDAGLSVAMTKTMNLTVGFQDRYDSLAQSPAKQNDTLFLAGVNVKFGAN